MEIGAVVITEEISEQPGQERVVVVNTRVSANKNRPNLGAQAERLCAYRIVQDLNVQAKQQEPQKAGEQRAVS
jgi:predicted site-specific integrase-resolvase